MNFFGAYDALYVKGCNDLNFCYSKYSKITVLQNAIPKVYVSYLNSSQRNGINLNEYLQTAKNFVC